MFEAVYPATLAQHYNAGLSSLGIGIVPVSVSGAALAYAAPPAMQQPLPLIVDVPLGFSDRFVLGTEAVSFSDLGAEKTSLQIAVARLSEARSWIDGAASGRKTRGAAGKSPAQRMFESLIAQGNPDIDIGLLASAIYYLNGRGSAGLPDAAMILMGMARSDGKAYSDAMLYRAIFAEMAAEALGHKDARPFGTEKTENDLSEMHIIAADSWSSLRYDPPLRSPQMRRHIMNRAIWHAFRSGVHAKYAEMMGRSADSVHIDEWEKLEPAHDWLRRGYTNLVGMPMGPEMWKRVAGDLGAAWGQVVVKAGLKGDERDRYAWTFNLKKACEAFAEGAKSCPIDG